jgi:DNA primase
MQKKGYAQEFIDKVKAANNIIDIARSYMTLKQKGQDFWGCCPFHKEKTPSFKISNTHQAYYCFGCRASGNVISLVMQMESLSWREALEHLAKRANIELPKIDDNFGKDARKKEKILSALAAARDFYCSNLRKAAGKNALEYLHSRGIDDDLIKMFRIGYSGDWQGVIDELKRKGFTEAEMQDAGIAAANGKGRIWDAQYERITFAIHDIYGNCIGFTGRTMSGDANIAKYKNTAETAVFNKSNILYGIDVMKECIRNVPADYKMQGLIVVEGNVDEISMIKHGFVNTVACMGTAMTPFHARIFARFGSQVYLCLDGDDAGQKATLKSIDVLKKEGLAVRVVPLTDKDDPHAKIDPDDFLKKYGAAAMHDLLAKSVDGVDFKLDYIGSATDTADNIGKTEYLRKAVDILLELDSPAERELYIPKIADTVDVSADSVRATVDAKTKKEPQTAISGIPNTHNKHNITPKPPNRGAAALAEKFIIAAILHKKPFADSRNLPKMSDSLYERIIDGKWDLNRLYDELNDDELKMLQDVYEYRFNGSDAEQLKEWQDDIAYLNKKEAERRISEIASSALGTAEKAKAIQEIREKQNG